MQFWPAILLGVAGSLHCVGMCGPLMLAIPYADSGKKRLVELLIYQAGRILTYVLIGLILGLLGWGIYLAKMQSQLSIFAGVTLLIIGLFQINPDALLSRWSYPRKWQKLRQKKFSRFLRKQNAHSRFVLGMLNGLLPCGLVYMAAIGAVGAGHPGNGALFMLFFGIGTLPLLISSLFFGNVLFRRFGLNLRRWQSYLVAAVGVLLIWRGVHFYLPPDFHLWQAINFAPRCFGGF